MIKIQPTLLVNVAAHESILTFRSLPATNIFYMNSLSIFSKSYILHKLEKLDVFLTNFLFPITRMLLALHIHY